MNFNHSDESPDDDAAPAHAVRPTRMPASTLLALILLALTAATCVSLGRWQLERAEARRETQRQITFGRSLAPLALTSETPVETLQEWRMVRAQGQWRNDLSVLLDNRNHHGQPGFWLATPLILSDQSDQSPTAVLVLRGWFARQFTQTGQPNGVMALPPDVHLSASDEVQSVQGQLRLQVPRMLELWSFSGHNVNQLPSALPDTSNPLPVVTNLDLDAYAAASGLSLVPVVIQQTTDTSLSEDGLDRTWAEPSVNPDKHTAYAIQWLGFAAIALGACIVISWRALRRQYQRAC